MLKIRRILVPNDRGPCTAHAYPYALELAEWFGAEIHLVEADVPVDRVHDAPRVSVAEPPPGVTCVKATVRSDSVADALLHYAEEHDVDLIVMGTHGLRGVAHALLGSTAEHVVREARCPVLTVRLGADGRALLERGDAPTFHRPPPVRRLLVPIDFSERAEEALRYAFALAEAWHARVDVLHAVNVPVVPDIYGLDGGAWSVATPDLVEQSREALNRLLRTLAPPGRLGEVLVEVDVPAAAILDAAERLGTDLIVISTHGLTGLKRFALGSVTERVVRRAACPVFTVKSFGKSLLYDGAPLHEESAIGGEAAVSEPP